MDTAYEIQASFERGDASALEIVRVSLECISRLNDRYGAFVSIDEEGALTAAKRLDHARATGSHIGKLAGVPVAIKDNIATEAMPTTCGSRILREFQSTYDAHVVTRLVDEDAIVVGKTNMDEFAMGSSTENSAVCKTRNPWDKQHVPGGSSGGSAVAVACGMVPVALGSDTGGSIRQPASFCGVLGLKPTYGRVSRYGLVAYGSSLDQIGPFARDSRDLALLLSVIAGHDRRDSTSLRNARFDLAAKQEPDLSNVKVGIVDDLPAEGLDSCVQDAVSRMGGVVEQRGGKRVVVSLPHLSYAVAAYYIIAMAEASANLARFDGVHYGERYANPNNLQELYEQTRGTLLGDEVKRRIMLGTYVLSSGYYDAYYLQAQRVRTIIREEFASAFDVCDVVLMPTAPTPPYRLGEKNDDPLTMYLEDIYTVPANLIGACALSIPAGFTDDGLPIGAQLMAAPMNDGLLLNIADCVEQTTDYHKRKPFSSAGEDRESR